MHSWGPGMRQCYIIHYVRKGAGWLEVENKKYRISEGECFLTYPYEKIFYYPDKVTPWEYYWIDFIGSEAEKHLFKGILRQNHPIGSIKYTKALKAYFERLQTIEINLENRAEANGILVCILGMLEDANCQREVVDEVNTLAKLIFSNYHRSSFTIETLSKMTGISQPTLYRRFREQFEMSPKQYLTNYRLNQAKNLLSQGSSVKTAAISCGYADQLYFTRVFTKNTGMTPSQFKKQAENQI